MNNQNDIPEKGELSRLLRAWQVRAPLPDGFEERVRRQVSVGDATAFQLRRWSWGETLRTVFSAPLLRPGWALGYAIGIMVFGVMVGGWVAEHWKQDVWSRLERDYVSAVAPWAAGGEHRP